MTPLGEEIRRLIRRHGPIGIAEYMALCLGHPVHGYYTAREPFGLRGDFVTAPEISQIFGELLGLWAAATWMEMGAPRGLRLVEIGAGRGVLMADALRAVRTVPGFSDGATLHLVETSPRLRQEQAERLGHAGPVWHDRVEDVPDGPAIFLANEMFDALPVRQFVKSDDGWRERVIGLQDDALVFGVSAEPVVPPWPPSPAGEVETGAVCEVSPAARAMARTLAERLAGQGGAALVVDYGRVRSGPGETFQAVRGHAPVDPLAEPGLADLTAHVDFEALAEAARAGGACVFPVLDQGEFLRRMGIDVRAERLKAQSGPAGAAEIDAAVHRLCGAEQMGRLFKVFAFGRKGLHPPGFDPVAE